MVHTSMFAEEVGREWHAGEFEKERISFFQKAQGWLIASFVAGGIGGYLGLNDSTRNILMGESPVLYFSLTGLALLVIIIAYALTTNKAVYSLSLFVIPLLCAMLATSIIFTQVIAKKPDKQIYGVNKQAEKKTAVAALNTETEEQKEPSGMVFLEFFIFALLAMISNFIYLKFFAKRTHSFWWSILFSLPPIVIGLPVLFLIKAAWWELLAGSLGAWLWALFIIFDSKIVWKRARRNEPRHSALSYYLDFFSILIIPIFLRRKPENERKETPDIAVPK